MQSKGTKRLLFTERKEKVISLASNLLFSIWDSRLLLKQNSEEPFNLFQWKNIKSPEAFIYLHTTSDNITHILSLCSNKYSNEQKLCWLHSQNGWRISICKLKEFERKIQVSKTIFRKLVEATHFFFKMKKN